MNRPPALPPGTGRVFRDPYGIPHLWGRSAEDLAYLQGYTAALDRAWQIEVARWRGEGRLAERIGRCGLDSDAFVRRAGLPAAVRTSYRRLGPAHQNWCAAYADGVNAGLPDGALRAGEFTRVGAVAGRWSPWTPIGVFAVTHLLFGTCQYKLWRERVATTVGPAWLDLLGLEGADPAAGAGSNAFAVTGARTASGRPILAGDPHRTIEQPGGYQQVRLACPEFDVVGLAFPGVPGLPHFGHAGSVAWATTNAMADYQDLYREELRRDGRRVLVREPAGWAEAAVRVEQVAVAGGAPIELEVIATGRGGVVIGGPGVTSFSLATPALGAADWGFGCLLPQLRAGTLDQLEQAMAGWVEPVNAVLIADAREIRSLITGRVPARSHRNRVRPVAGAEPAYAWQGEEPRPPARRVADLVVNANDRASGAGLGYDYASPDRARRMLALIGDRTGLTVADLAAVSLDTRQPAYARIRPRLAAARAAGAAGRFRDQVLAWDGHADADSRAAAAFAAWRAAFVDWLLAQPALAALVADPDRTGVFAAVLDPRVRIGTAWEGLLHHGTALGLDVEAGIAEALRRAAEAPDPGRWGDRHAVRPVVIPAERADLERLGSAPTAGDSGCVLATRSQPGLQDRCSFGPVARYVWDLAARDDSRWIVPLGSSGQSRSPHRRDQLPAWAGGHTIPVVTDWARLRPDAVVPIRRHSGIGAAGVTEEKAGTRDDD